MSAWCVVVSTRRYMITPTKVLPPPAQRRWRLYHPNGRGVHVTRRGTWWVRARGVKDDAPSSVDTLTSVIVNGARSKCGGVALLRHVCDAWWCHVHVRCRRSSGRCHVLPTAERPTHDGGVGVHVVRYSRRHHLVHHRWVQACESPGIGRAGGCASAILTVVWLCSIHRSLASTVNGISR